MSSLARPFGTARRSSRRGQPPPRRRRCRCAQTCVAIGSFHCRHGCRERWPGGCRVHSRRLHSYRSGRLGGDVWRAAAPPPMRRRVGVWAAPVVGLSGGAWALGPFPDGIHVAVELLSARSDRGRATPCVQGGGGPERAPQPLGFELPLRLRQQRCPRFRGQHGVPRGLNLRRRAQAPGAAQRTRPAIRGLPAELLLILPLISLLVIFPLYVFFLLFLLGSSTVLSVIPGLGAHPQAVAAHERWRHGPSARKRRAEVLGREIR